jgi:hypothetical protein
MWRRRRRRRRAARHNDWWCWRWWWGRRRGRWRRRCLYRCGCGCYSMVEWWPVNRGFFGVLPGRRRHRLAEVRLNRWSWKTVILMRFVDRRMHRLPNTRRKGIVGALGYTATTPTTGVSWAAGGVRRHHSLGPISRANGWALGHRIGLINRAIWKNKG